MRDDRLFDEHIPRLRRYARALTGDRTQADDLVQECLARAWQKLALWRRGSDLRAWLFTILHNLHVNEIRHRRSRPEPQVLDETAFEVAHHASVDDGLRLRDLEAALRQLPAEQRQVVLLVGLEDMSYEDTARTLGIPVGTVMSRLARGRERLRALMNGTGPALRRVK